jgi:hypothetical protein
MLTGHRHDGEGNTKPARGENKSSKLHDFIMACDRKSLNHWRTWLTPHVLSYNTVEPVDEVFFGHESRATYWPQFRELIQIDSALVFLDPDTGLETGTSTYRKRMGPEKYLLDDELSEMYKWLHPESIIMVYQHLPKDKRRHSEAVHSKVTQARSVCCGAFICAYREDDLAFVFLAKTAQRAARLHDVLSRYDESSSHKYKEAIP